MQIQITYCGMFFPRPHYTSTTELAWEFSGPREWYFISIKLIRETKLNEKQL